MASSFPIINFGKPDNQLTPLVRDWSIYKIRNEPINVDLIVFPDTNNNVCKIASLIAVVFQNT